MRERCTTAIWFASVWCLSTVGFAVEIPVLDSSFELLTRAPSSTPFAPREWAIFSPGGAAGIQTLDPPLPGQQGPDVGYLEIDNDSAFAVAFLDSTIIREGTYQATVSLAHQPGAEPTVQPFKINYEAVGFGFFGSVGSNTIPVGTANSASFTDVSGSATIEAGSGAIGKYMRLVLVADAPPEPATARYLLDNVRMTFTPAGGGTPEPVFLGEASFQPTAWHRVFSDGNNAGQHRPEAPLFTNQTGDQLGFATISSLGGYGGVFQDHGTIQAGTYTLTAAMGLDATAMPADSYMVLKFEALGPGFFELIDQQSIITPGELNTTTLTDKSNVVVIEPGSPLIGKTLRSVIVGEGAEFIDGRYFFDNVRIDFTPVATPGDFDGDGDVDGADFVAWQTNFPTTSGASGAQGDADGDGDVDGADFDAWQTSFPSSGAGTSPVPEPGAWMLAANALLVVIGGRLKTRR